MPAYGLRRQSLLNHETTDLTFASNSARKSFEISFRDEQLGLPVCGTIVSAFVVVLVDCWDVVEARHNLCQMMVASTVTVCLHQRSERFPAGRHIVRQICTLML